MPQSQFADVWAALSPDLRSRLVRDSARRLTPDDVDELARAGGRVVHALWLDTRPGRTRQWSTSWEFRRFVDHVRESEHRSPATDSRWIVRTRVTLRP